MREREWASIYLLAYCQMPTMPGRSEFNPVSRMCDKDSATCYLLPARMYCCRKRNQKQQSRGSNQALWCGTRVSWQCQTLPQMPDSVWSLSSWKCYLNICSFLMEPYCSGGSHWTTRVHSFLHGFCCIRYVQWCISLKNVLKVVFFFFIAQVQHSFLLGTYCWRSGTRST